MQDNYTTKGKHFKTAPKFSIVFLFHFCKKLNLFFYLWYDYDYTKIKQKGQYDYEKNFIVISCFTEPSDITTSK